LFEANNVAAYAFASRGADMAANTSGLSVSSAIPSTSTVMRYQMAIRIAQGQLQQMEQNSVPATIYR
jgi:hypothetical protein